MKKTYIYKSLIPYTVIYSDAKIVYDNFQFTKTRQQWRPINIRRIRMHMVNNFENKLLTRTSLTVIRLNASCIFKYILIYWQFWKQYGYTGSPSTLLAVINSDNGYIYFYRRGNNCWNLNNSLVKNHDGILEDQPVLEVIDVVRRWHRR